jgi:hypothetical protein
VTYHTRYRRPKESNLMFAIAENTVYLATQHPQNILGEAGADSLFRAAQQGSPHLAARLITQARETLARITEGERLPAPAAGIPLDLVTDLHPVM